MKSLWTASISFGLINIPVRLYSAAESNGLDLDMLERKSLQPIGYKRVIRGTNREVEYKEIVRGYQVSKGRYVVLTDLEIAAARPGKSRLIEIQAFCPEEQIDSKYYEKPYYLEPEEKAVRAYALLREALRKSGKVALAVYVMREKEHIAVLKAEGNVLLLNQMRYHEDIRSTEGLKIPPKAKPLEKELSMAMQLIEQLSEDFKPEAFKDTFTGALLKVIKSKAKGKLPKALAAETNGHKDTKVDDLLAMLQKSLGAKAAPAKKAAAKAKPVSGKAKPAAKKAAAPAKKKAAASRSAANGKANKAKASASSARRTGTGSAK